MEKKFLSIINYSSHFLFFYRSSTKSIAYSLKVTHIFPRSGSLYGGTVVTVTGQGFGNTASHIKASFGGHTCNVVGTVTDTQFKCQITATGKVHQVTNQGTSSGKKKKYIYKYICGKKNICVKYNMCMVCKIEIRHYFSFHDLVFFGKSKL